MTKMMILFVYAACCRACLTVLVKYKSDRFICQHSIICLPHMEMSNHYKSNSDSVANTDCGGLAIYHSV